MKEKVKENPRFSGVERLVGKDGLARLARARVLVVGLGGVGSWTVEALARSGVGTLSLMDGDDVCVTNTNRQLHAVAETVGQPKAEVLAARVRAINPACRVVARREFFRRDEEARPFDETFDFVVDCVDGVMAKATLIGNCHERGIPVVSCGGAAGKLDPGQVQVADLSRVHHDRLLMFVRKKLRKHYGFPGRGNKRMGISCVFSPEPIREPDACSVEVREEDNLIGDARSGPACDTRLGSAVFVTAVFGFHAAGVVVRALSESGAVDESR
ncbi:MAG: tRNA threonylcarbamoyladenosine dehydratase [Kiritimatiellae bacterium]|nr:tRNA threonylcarbamoyladenosine dehydratase [Kiritimatiellia bacterium]